MLFAFPNPNASGNLKKILLLPSTSTQGDYRRIKSLLSGMAVFSDGQMLLSSASKRVFPYPSITKSNIRNFDDLTLLFLFNSIEKIYQTCETVFHLLSEYLEFRQKHSTRRRIFNIVLPKKHHLSCLIFII